MPNHPHEFRESVLTRTVEIYTDGACRGNPGPGGWGALLIAGRHRKTLHGGEHETTNNRMELTAAMSTSFGLGGHNAALVFGALNGDA